jgi:hypothetical protein
MSHLQGFLIALVAIGAAHHYDVIDALGFWLLWFVLMWDVFDDRPSRRSRRNDRTKGTKDE